MVKNVLQLLLVPASVLLVPTPPLWLFLIP